MSPKDFVFYTNKAKILKNFWNDNGFLILKNFCTNDECNQLIKRASELVEKFDIEEHKITFNTKDNSHSAEKYFLDSGDKIRFFFEDEAFNKKGQLRVKKENSINKIGHALHDLDDTFNNFSRNKKLYDLSNILGFQNSLLLQSMYIFKQPKIGGEVVCHQDSTFLNTKPESVVGFWFALEDATISNGCLWVKTGGHKGSLKKLFVKINNKMKLKNLNNDPMDIVDTPLEAKKGTLILLHGRLPHQSGNNLSNKSRQAYTLHIIDGKTKYMNSNWLQRNNNLPLKGFVK